MAGETQVTVVGNLTGEVELRRTGTGVAVANFTIASTPRVYDKNAGQWVDGETLFLRCTVWRDYAEHVAASLQKGTRVVAQGRLVQRSYETQQGEKRTTFELGVEEIGPSLRYATAQVTKTGSNSAGSGWATPGRESTPNPSMGQANWVAQEPAQGFSDEPPF